MKILRRSNIISRELPPLLPLNDQIQRLLQLSIQPPHVVFPVCLRLSFQRRLNSHNVLVRNHLRIITNPRLSILEQTAHNTRLVTQLITHFELVIPRLRVLALVHAEFFGHCALALVHFEVPVQAARRVRLEVYVGDEGSVEALFEALLVEEEGVLKGLEPAR